MIIIFAKNIYLNLIIYFFHNIINIIILFLILWLFDFNIIFCFESKI